MGTDESTKSLLGRDEPESGRIRKRREVRISSSTCDWLVIAILFIASLVERPHGLRIVQQPHHRQESGIEVALAEQQGAEPPPSGLLSRSQPVTAGHVAGGAPAAARQTVVAVPASGDREANLGSEHAVRHNPDFHEDDSALSVPRAVVAATSYDQGHMAIGNEEFGTLARQWAAPTPIDVGQHQSRKQRLLSALPTLFHPRRVEPGDLRRRALVVAAAADAAALQPHAARDNAQVGSTRSQSSARASRAARRRLGSTSQSAQEIGLIERYFGCANHTGSFLEVGARDGLAQSNTLFLERNGSWRGLCVEASPSDFVALQRNRPACVAVHAVAAAERGRVWFEHPLGFSSSLAGVRATHHDISRLESETRTRGRTLANTSLYAVSIPLARAQSDPFDLLRPCSPAVTCRSSTMTHDTPPSAVPR